MTQETLLEELQSLEGIIRQDRETGKLSMVSYVTKYTNRVFGAPFQYLDSVDKRFDKVNPNVGNEYLRNILLNTPVLRIRPGMPKYTGGDSDGGLGEMIKNIYFGNNTGELSAVEGLLSLLAKSTIFGAGKKLQRRMFGFRETYHDYMQYVNYMCRSCATYLYLTDGKRFPSGAFPSRGSSKEPPVMKTFDKFDWQNYRMMDNSVTKSPTEYLGSLLGHSVDPILRPILSFSNDSPEETVAKWLDSRMGMSPSDVLDSYDLLEQLDFIEDDKFSGIVGQIGNKVTTVDFMVNPDQTQETITNTTGKSMVEQGIDALQGSIGSEIGWITNSHADVGVIGGMMEFLGNGIENVTAKVAELGENVTGGFVGGLFTGAVSAIRGQKMIYPEIYKSSNSEMNKQFDIVLTTPYGDIYNYYMHILVPLMHLIALAAPRMVTSNTVASPFIVQGWIPGSYTCQLGIISQMTITKNPNSNRVSVNGFPLEVKVTFTIKELYNALSISPSNDPSSFMFNETLNDYLANLSGLIPSADTYTLYKEASFNAMQDYVIGGGVIDDMASFAGEYVEDFGNPFANR